MGVEVQKAMMNWMVYDEMADVSPAMFESLRERLIRANGVPRDMLFDTFANGGPFATTKVTSHTDHLARIIEIKRERAQALCRRTPGTKPHKECPALYNPHDYNLPLNLWEHTED